MAGSVLHTQGIAVDLLHLQEKPNPPDALHDPDLVLSDPLPPTLSLACSVPATPDTSPLLENASYSQPQDLFTCSSPAWIRGR